VVPAHLGKAILSALVYYGKLTKFVLQVLQEVAAARSVRIMYGSMEIDGYAFSLCLEALPGVYNRMSSVTYLMKQTIFRPQYKIDVADRVSLDISPLGGLIDMYHTRKATDRRDKVFALLGMSSDDPSVVEAAGLLPDYEIVWEELFKRLIWFILGGQVSVRTWPDREMAIIQGKGCVLGVVSSADEKNLCVTPKTALLPTQWAPQPSAKLVRAGDLICLLQGAPRPMIIRPQEDHFSVIIISVTSLGSFKTGGGNGGRPQSALPPLPCDLPLVWNWERSQTDWHDRNESCLVKAIRMRNTALVLQDGELYEEAERIYRNIEGICEGGIFKLYDVMMEDIVNSEHGKKVLLIAYLAYRPLSVSEMATVAGLEPTIGPDIIAEVSGFLAIRNGVVDATYPSVKDYLKQAFSRTEVDQGHAEISRRSIDAISKLDQNIHGQKPAFHPKDILPALDPDPLAPIRYCCTFWANHLLEQFNPDAVLTFLKDHFLRWVEALSLLEDLTAGIQSIKKLLVVAQVCSNYDRFHPVAKC